MSVFNLDDEISLVEVHGQKVIYLVGDSFYGYYTIEEFKEIVDLFNRRYEEIKKELCK